MSDGISGIETVYKSGSNNSNVATDLKPDEIFDNRYVVIKKLGAGGMGAAYLAKDNLTNEEIVLKLINSSILDDQTKQRMIDEGVNTRKIKHPNIVSVHDVKEVDGQVYLTMEYVKGQPLRHWMSASMASGINSPMPYVVMLIMEILAGLQAAHIAGIIHRDLKPENIILETPPEEGNVKLKIIDFGIATAQQPAATTTSTGAIGAPLYMAPEQMTMPDAVRASADVYSVGRMFYEMLMDVLPDGMWSPPSATRQDVPVGLDGVIQKALQPPKGRYQSAAEFAEAISAAVDGGRGPIPTPNPNVNPNNVNPNPNPTPPPTPPAVTGPKWNFKPWLYVGAAVVVVALVYDEFGSGTGPTQDTGGKTQVGLDLDLQRELEQERQRALQEQRDLEVQLERERQLVTPVATQSWRTNDGNYFTMQLNNGSVSGTGFLSGLGQVSLRGNPNDYLQVYDSSNQYIADFVGGLIPSSSGAGMDFSGTVMSSGQNMGSVFFHIDH